MISPVKVAILWSNLLLALQKIKIFKYLMVAISSLSFSTIKSSLQPFNYNSWLRQAGGVQATMSLKYPSKPKRTRWSVSFFERYWVDSSHQVSKSSKEGGLQKLCFKRRSGKCFFLLQVLGVSLDWKVLSKLSFGDWKFNFRDFAIRVIHNAINGDFVLGLFQI